MGSCLDENGVLDFLQGRLSSEARARAVGHIDECVGCAALLTELARGLGSVEAREMAMALTAGVSAIRVGSSSAGDTGRETGVPHVVSKNTTLGRYRALRVLGSGAMGTVYVAEDPKLQRLVALKVLRSDGTAAVAESPDLAARLLREAQAMARLSHPNVVTVFDVGVVDGRVFIAMEFVHGVTLRDWLANQPRGWRDTIERFVQAGRGLAAAHAAGIVHRDFKPENVLIGDDGGVARVTDFGLARTAEAVASQSDGKVSLDSAQSVAGVAVGTPRYMAPEQIRGEQVDSRADVFSFAVALFRALYGVFPFEADTLSMLHDAIEAKAIRKPPRRASVPLAVWSVLSRALEPSQDARTASMDVLLDALERILRRRGRTMVLAAGIAIAASSGVLAFGLARLADRPREETGVRDDALAAAGAARGGNPCGIPSLLGRWNEARRDSLAAAARKRDSKIGVSIAGRAVAHLDAWASRYETARTRSTSAAPRSLLRWCSLPKPTWVSRNQRRRVRTRLARSQS